MCNSLLVGLVSISGCCDKIHSWEAVVIGSIGTIIDFLVCKIFDKLKIDDPLEASQIHLFCGLWGIISVGLFDSKDGVFFTGTFSLVCT